MVKGLKFTIPSAELKAHLAARADAHATKAAEYELQATAMKDLVVNQAQTLNPGESLKASARQHRAKKQSFTFMVEHVIENEVYCLDDADLAAIEVIDRGW